jgi:hypothetical protein
MRHIAKWMLAAGTVAAMGCVAQAQVQEGPAPTTALVTIESKGNAPVSPQTLTLQVNGRNTPIDSVTPVNPAGTELAILIDDGLRGNVALQFGDLKQFIQTLPPQVHVLLGYMDNGTVRQEGGFTTDHEAIVGKIRIPMSVGDASASPYFCLSDFVKRWPSNQRAARVVLMITNGVDPYNGSTSIMNQDSPYVQEATDDAQRAGVAVYALYYGDSGMRGGRANFSGQSYLQQMASSTGGESLYNGSFSPVEFAPYLKQFGKDLQESYLLGFQANATHEKKDTLTRIKVKSTEAGVKVHAPDAVHPGVDD